MSEAGEEDAMTMVTGLLGRQPPDTKSAKVRPSWLAASLGPPIAAGR
jgi:hypothetical protein